MFIGPMINSAAIVVGGVIGASFGQRIPERVRVALPSVFGLVSMGMGVIMLAGAAHLPVMVVAVLLGATLGELFRIEHGINLAAAWLRKRATRNASPLAEDKPDDVFIERFVTVVILFCASGTGIFGALHEGMTGDYSILVAKAFLDLSGAIIFASTLGIAVAAIALPQFIIQMLLATSAIVIVPLTNDLMRADFSAVGGVLMLAAGLRICGILKLPIANLLPALVLAMPVSWLWVRVF